MRSPLYERGVRGDFKSATKSKSPYIPLSQRGTSRHPRLYRLYESRVPNPESPPLNGFLSAVITTASITFSM